MLIKMSLENAFDALLLGKKYDGCFWAHFWLHFYFLVTRADSWVREWKNANKKEMYVRGSNRLEFVSMKGVNNLIEIGSFFDVECDYTHIIISLIIFCIFFCLIFSLRCTYLYRSIEWCGERERCVCFIHCEICVNSLFRFDIVEDKKQRGIRVAGWLAGWLAVLTRSICRHTHTHTFALREWQTIS